MPDATPGGDSPKDRERKLKRVVQDSLDFRGRVQAVCSSVKSVNALAKEAGVSEGTIRKWAAGDSEPSRDRLLAFARAAGVDPYWLLDGTGSMRPPGGAGEAVSSWIQGASPMDLNEYAPIPRVDVMAAAGDAVLLPTEEIVDFLLFKKSWLRRELGIDPQRAVVVQAKGDSMKPSIRDGDLLLVEVLQERANDDGIYVINVGGRVMVKRLQFLLDGSIKVVSDNAAYEPQVVKGDKGDGFWVVGRVVWSGSRL